MRNVICLFAAFAVLAVAGTSFAATLSATYGWEDGSGTILGSYGNLANPANVSSGSEISAASVITPSVTPYSGSQMLTFSEDPHDSTPQAYLAYIEGLDAGDVVTASFYGWDSTPSASPSLRIWGHYAEEGDALSYTGSASGNTAYTDGNGWGLVSWSWTIPSGQSALVVEGRPYSSPSTGATYSTYFIDDISVEVTGADETTTITFAGVETVVPEPSTIAMMLLAGLGLVGVRRRAG